MRGSKFWCGGGGDKIQKIVLYTCLYWFNDRIFSLPIPSLSPPYFSFSFWPPPPHLALEVIRGKILRVMIKKVGGDPWKIKKLVGRVKSQNASKSPKIFVSWKNFRCRSLMQLESHPPIVIYLPSLTLDRLSSIPKPIRIKIQNLAIKHVTWLINF